MNEDGLHFYDMASHREMLLKVWTDGREWLFYKHPDGQWVSLRQATEEDMQQIAEALDRAFKGLEALNAPLPTTP